jgi:hypothetical protein
MKLSGLANDGGTVSERCIANDGGTALKHVD